MRELFETYEERLIIGEIYLPVERLVAYYGEKGDGPLIDSDTAVTVAGVLSALKVTGGKIADQVLLFQGAGEAEGLGDGHRPVDEAVLGGDQVDRQVVFAAGEATVDVIISNCVINLSVDKPAVMAEMHRVLAPGGRIGISDVVAEDRLSPADRAARGGYAECIGGALSESEYRDGLRDAGFVDVEVAFTHEVADGLHGAIVKAVKPA